MENTAEIVQERHPVVSGKPGDAESDVSGNRADAPSCSKSQDSTPGKTSAKLLCPTNFI